MALTRQDALSNASRSLTFFAQRATVLRWQRPRLMPWPSTVISSIIILYGSMAVPFSFSRAFEVRGVVAARDDVGDMRGFNTCGMGFQQRREVVFDKNAVSRGGAVFGGLLQDIWNFFAAAVYERDAVEVQPVAGFFKPSLLGCPLAFGHCDCQDFVLIADGFQVGCVEN